MPDASFYTNPFFWALMSMFGMVGATSLFSKHSLRRSRIFVAIVLILITVGRIVFVDMHAKIARPHQFGAAHEAGDRPRHMIGKPKSDADGDEQQQ